MASDDLDDDPERRALFFALDDDGDGRISKAELLGALERSGLQLGGPRLRELGSLAQIGPEGLDQRGFADLIAPCAGHVQAALRGELAIADFAGFSAELGQIFEDCRALRDGKVATYIPQLGRVDPELFGLAICSVDGQRAQFGDATEEFCVQSVCKPINYCLALERHGEQVVHRHVGREPSGQGFSEITLDKQRRPHNPMINAGAIMCCALIEPGLGLAERFDTVMRRWQHLCGQKVGFSNAVYLSERKTADRNFAIGYFMQEHRCFPPGTDLIETLEFYFQCCSIEADCARLSVAAATLANGGVSPITGERIFSAETVRHCLSLMLSCGMYDFSGEFAFAIGLPAKSGVAGGVMVVIPNLLGMCIFSPRLDPMGNSVRAVEVCRRLVQTYNFHVYDSLTGASPKRDPRRPRGGVYRAGDATDDDVDRMIRAAARGDLDGLRDAIARGRSLDAANVDGRTALHLAVTEGQLAAIRYLRRHGARDDLADRWGATPRGLAEQIGQPALIAALDD